MNVFTSTNNIVKALESKKTSTLTIISRWWWIQKLRPQSKNTTDFSCLYPLSLSLLWCETTSIRAYPMVKTFHQKVLFYKKISLQWRYLVLVTKHLQKLLRRNKESKFILKGWSFPTYCQKSFVFYWETIFLIVIFFYKNLRLEILYGRSERFLNKIKKIVNDMPDLVLQFIDMVLQFMYVIWAYDYFLLSHRNPPPTLYTISIFTPYGTNLHTL